MSTECISPPTGGPQSWAPSPGGQYGALASDGCWPPCTPAPGSLPRWRWRALLAAAVLCYINLLNYMNWFIIPGEEGRVAWAASQVSPLCRTGTVALLPLPFLLLKHISADFTSLSWSGAHRWQAAPLGCRQMGLCSAGRPGGEDGAGGGGEAGLPGSAPQGERLLPDCFCSNQLLACLAQCVCLLPLTHSLVTGLHLPLSASQLIIWSLIHSFSGSHSALSLKILQCVCTHVYV